MSDLAGNPKDRFSRDMAHIVTGIIKFLLTALKLKSICFYNGQLRSFHN